MKHIFHDIFIVELSQCSNCGSDIKEAKRIYPTKPSGIRHDVMTYGCGATIESTYQPGDKKSVIKAGNCCAMVGKTDLEKASKPVLAKNNPEERFAVVIRKTDWRYRRHYTKEEAQKEAQRLAAEKLDVFFVALAIDAYRPVQATERIRLTSAKGNHLNEDDIPF